MEQKTFKQGSEDYLIDCTDRIIADIVIEKESLFKAYNYYQGFRDKYQYQHLEENYGVGNPVSIKFTPLIKKHIDAIVGEYLTTEVQCSVSCKDNKTLTNIMRDKQLDIAKKQREYLSQVIDNGIQDAIAGKPLKNKAQTDAIVAQELENIKESVNLNFISNYEIAAQVIIQHVKESRAIDLEGSRQHMLLDLLLYGAAFFKIKPTESGDNFRLEVEDPLNTFMVKHYGSNYVKDGSKSVVRKWLTKEEIAITYGEYLSAEDLKSLENHEASYYTEGNYTWMAAMESRGILDGVTIHPEEVENPPYLLTQELIPVYEVEWIDYSDSLKKAIRYTTTRIGGDIYILTGEDEYLVRTQDAPKQARLSLNGIFYSHRGLPYSMMLAAVDLQDIYDLLLYQKNNLIALGGTKGANVDVAHLPEFLGENMQERILKYQAYRKMGIAFFDSSQDGEMMNTTFNGYDDSVSVSAIQAILAAIQITEDTVSSITGVPRERLGGIQARDAVANVEVGMLLSFIITKQYMTAINYVLSEVFVDSIDMAKKVYKKGLTGKLILGDYVDIITLLPEYYTFTDFGISLLDPREVHKEKELIHQYALELSKGNLVDPVDLASIMAAKSLTEMKLLVKNSAKKKKAENDLMQQMTQQLQEAEKQIKELTQQLEESNKKIAKMDERKMTIEQENNLMKNKLEWYKAQTAVKLKELELDLINKRNKLEAALLIDQNPNNDEVSNDRI